jgi:hypothetical protein
MLARSRLLHLARGGLAGPLLIPSVSSKGFPLINGLAESGVVLDLVSQDLSDALLISAYDLHHGLLPDKDRLLSADHAQTLYGTPKLLVVDSGGYELSEVFESSETRRGAPVVRPYSRDDFEALVNELPTDRELLVVTYDEPTTDRPSYGAQLEIGQRFAADRPRIKIDFLLKPAGEALFIEPREFAPDAGDVRIFAAVGVTEKELGDGLLERLMRLAELRMLLDNSGAEAIPLHVFGGLDPVLTPLYFMAGAEIFDGLSWLRYGYYGGAALHREEFAVLMGNSGAPEVRRDMLRYISNLYELRRLAGGLQRWASEPDRYEVLGPHHEQLREIYETMTARLNVRG